MFSIVQNGKTANLLNVFFYVFNNRTMSVKDLLASGIASNGLVEPMVWVYVEDIDHFVDGDTWRTYSAVFAHLWTASAFKGAFGERLFMPNLHRHYRFV